MQSEAGDPGPFRLLWYVASTLKMAGGGERLIMEGLRQFEIKGRKAVLLLGSPMPNEAALFDSTYTPNIQVLSGQVSGQSVTSPTFLKRAIRRIHRELRLAGSLSKAVLLSGPTVVIANSQDECRTLWLARFLSVRQLPVHLTFVHGSRFQFAEDASKYALVFRRHLARIRDADPVYAEMIPAGPPAMSLTRRLRLEWNCLLDYLALRLTGYVVVHSQKNRREVELLYNRGNVVVVPAGGFSRAEFESPRGQDMKAAFQLGNRSVVLSVCRLVPKKRVDLTIRAFAQMLRSHPESDSIMVVGGSGPVEDYLRLLCRDLQIEERVRFIGFIPESQLRDWYTSCDVFVSTDNADYDLSVMMALPLACKVLVTRQYDFPDCLDKVLRYVHIAEPTERDLAEVMHEAIQSRPTPLNSADFVELDNLTWERYFEKILSLGEKLSR